MIINLSANNITHSDFLFDLNIGPVCTVLPLVSMKENTPKGRRVIVCPAVNSNITCSICGGNKGPLCWRVDRNYIIGFPAHGRKSKKVSEIANLKGEYDE